MKMKLSYLTCVSRKSQQVAIEVNKCGLLIDSNDFWLGASPDGIVFDPTQQEHQRGCLEVKCPYVCEKRTITDACRQVSAFCLVEHEGSMCLSESHKYFYQVQTQMHVSQLPWCDFVVWCPREIFVQRVCYNATFMNECLCKAKKFYFEKFLPSLAPYVIIKNSDDLATYEIAHDSRDTKAAPHTESNTQTRVSERSATTKSVAKVTTCATLLSSVDTQDDRITVGTAHDSEDTKTAPDTESNTRAQTRVSERSATTKSVAKVTTCATLSSSVDTQDVRITGETNVNTLSIQTVFQHLNIRKHLIKGDGDCLYHSVAHQAGLIPQLSQGDEYISQ